MNADRRKRLDKLVSRINDVRLEVESIRDEESDAYDNLPESLQGGEKGEKMSEAVDALESVISELEDVESNLSEVCSE